MDDPETFVQVAPDCPVDRAVVPVARGVRKPIHVLQYELLTESPYSLSHEDLLYEVHVRHKGLTPGKEVRDTLLAKPHPCLRASALTKKYGWGVHYDARGKIALYAVESAEYRRLSGPEAGMKVVLAMRNRRG
jgi:hypothetical protein